MNNTSLEKHLVSPIYEWGKHTSGLQWEPEYKIKWWFNYYIAFKLYQDYILFTSFSWPVLAVVE